MPTYVDIFHTKWILCFYSKDVCVCYISFVMNVKFHLYINSIAACSNFKLNCMILFQEMIYLFYFWKQVSKLSSDYFD